MYYPVYTVQRAGATSPHPPNPGEAGSPGSPYMLSPHYPTSPHSMPSVPQGYYGNYKADPNREPRNCDGGPHVAGPKVGKDATFAEASPVPELFSSTKMPVPGDTKPNAAASLAFKGPLTVTAVASPGATPRLASFARPPPPPPTASSRSMKIVRKLSLYLLVAAIMAGIGVGVYFGITKQQQKDKGKGGLHESLGSTNTTSPPAGGLTGTGPGNTSNPTIPQPPPAGSKPAASASPSPSPPPPPFVEHVTPAEVKYAFTATTATTFDRYCRPWYASGFSLHDAVESVMVTTDKYTTVGGLNGHEILARAFRNASMMGLNVVRTWAHTTSSRFPFQVSPGQYTEEGLEALDFVMDQARRNGLQVILSFVDNWKYYNGVDQYVDWSSTAPPRTWTVKKDAYGDASTADYYNATHQEYEAVRHSLFYTDQNCKDFYKAHVRTLINRKNMYNGMLYKDDPTILSWSLINEPRCETWAVKDCHIHVQNWIEEMAAFVKSLDSNHLLSIGSEGFYGLSDQIRFFSGAELPNPSPWAKDMGQNFMSNSMVDNIDFATIHSWADTWEQGDNIVDFQYQWVNQHVRDAKRLKKPLLFEEFGRLITADEWSPSVVTTKRNPVFRAAYTATKDSIDAGEPMTGAMFWEWKLPLHFNFSKGGYGVLVEDSTIDEVRRYSNTLRQLLNSVPPRPACGLGAWFGVVNAVTQARTCVNRPQVSTMYYRSPVATFGQEPAPLTAQEAEAMRWVENLRGLRASVFPTEAACCRPMTGAFELGCTSTSSSSTSVS